MEFVGKFKSASATYPGDGRWIRNEHVVPTSGGGVPISTTRIPWELVGVVPCVIRVSCPWIRRNPCATESRGVEWSARLAPVSWGQQRNAGNVLDGGPSNQGFCGVVGEGRIGNVVDQSSVGPCRPLLRPVL